MSETAAVSIKLPVAGKVPETDPDDRVTSLVVSNLKPIVLPEVTDVLPRAKSPLKVTALVVPAGTVNRPLVFEKVTTLSLNEVYSANLVSPSYKYKLPKSASEEMPKRVNFTVFT